MTDLLLWVSVMMLANSWWSIIKVTAAAVGSAVAFFVLGHQCGETGKC